MAEVLLASAPVPMLTNMELRGEAEPALRVAHMSMPSKGLLASQAEARGDAPEPDNTVGKMSVTCMSPDHVVPRTPGGTAPPQRKPRLRMPPSYTPPLDPRNGKLLAPYFWVPPLSEKTTMSV